MEYLTFFLLAAAAVVLARIIWLLIIRAQANAERRATRWMARPDHGDADPLDPEARGTDEWEVDDGRPPV
jgi:hypothetical protein